MEGGNENGGWRGVSENGNKRMKIMAASSWLAISENNVK